MPQALAASLTARRTIDNLSKQAAPFRPDPNYLSDFPPSEFDERFREKVIKYINEVRAPPPRPHRPRGASIWLPGMAVHQPAVDAAARRNSPKSPTPLSPCPALTHSLLRATLATRACVQLSEDFGLLVQTGCVACNYFDRYIPHRLREGPVSKQQVQTIASTCLLIASKFVDRKLPPLSELVVVHNQKVTSAEFAETERTILEVLDWQLHVPLPHAFLEPLRLCLPGAPFEGILEDRTHFFIDLSIYGARTHPPAAPPLPRAHPRPAATMSYAL